MWFLTVSLWLFFFGAVLLYISITKAKTDDKKYILNELIIISLILLAALLYPLIFIKTSVSTETQSLLFIITGIITNVEMIIFGIQILNEYLLCKKDPKCRESRCWNSYKSACLEKENSAQSVVIYNKLTKTDISRKSLHLIPPITIIIFFALGNILNNAGILENWGLDVLGFSNWLIMTLGMVFILMFAIGDIFRLLDCFQYLPDWAHKWYGSALNQEEWDTFMGTIPIVISLVPFIFTDFPVFLSSVLIGTLADATAAVVGKGIGKIKLKYSNHENKTVEGHFAGSFSAFIIVFVIMVVFSTPPLKSVIMAFVAAVIFMFVDRYAKKVSDNLLNPILCGLGLIVVYYLL